MAKQNTEDRIYRFLLDKGEEGASPGELAALFLSAGSVPDALADRVVKAILSRDRRFHQGADKRWRASPAARAGKDVYTVVEFCFVPGAGGADVPVECGVVRIEGDRRGESLSTLIRPPQPLAPAAQLPPEITRDALTSAPQLVRVLERLSAFARGTTMACYRRSPLHARACRDPDGREIPHLSIKKLARRMGVIGRAASLAECAEALEIVCPEQPRAGELASVSAQMLLALLGRLEETGVRGAEQISDFLHPEYIEVDMSRYGFDRDFLDTLPEGPGVYIMKDADGAPLYVGKAKDLRRRVASYFKRRVRPDERVERIRSRIHGLSVERVGSELEAILLEHRYIRELAPELNVQANVRQRAARRPPGRNLVLILPSRAAEHVELFMLRDGRELHQVRVARSEPQAAREAVARVFFSTTAAAAHETDAEDVELLLSWLNQNSDAANLIDVDAAGGAEQVGRLLGEYLAHDDPAGERVYRV